MGQRNKTLTGHFVFIGFHVLSLVDKGEDIEFATITDKIEEGDVLDWLNKKYDRDFDMSLFNEEQRREFNASFLDFTVINSRKKLGVENNGLLLLAAYCFEAINRLKTDEK